MFDLDSWHEIAVTLRRNLWRTTLTALGVLLGMLILLAMVAFGRSLESGVKTKMAGFAANSVYLWGQKTSEPYAGLLPGRPIEFTNADVEALRGIPEIEHLAPRNQLRGFMGGANVRYLTKTGSFQIVGDMPAFQWVQTPIMKAGRFLDELDIRDRHKICVIGLGVVEQLYDDGTEPIGTYLEINGVYFQVVGVFGTRQTGQQADRVLNTIHLPFTTFQQAFHYGDRVGWFAVTGKANASAAALETRIKEVLGERHQVAPTDKMAIGSWQAGEQFAKMNRLFTMVNFVMWFAGIMTLGAGVVGVSNIMLISVRERTKELGVRKALGATPLSVVRMIVSEAVVLTIGAGYLGIVLGVAALEWLHGVLARSGSGDLPFGPPEVDLTLAFGALGALAFFGVLAGILPALHAARIPPVEALRTE